MTTNTSMSIYNKYTDPKTKDVIFKKHLIENVFWDDSKGINLNMGYENADKVNIYVPKDGNDLSYYTTPKQYDGNGWTIQNGDFIVKGDTEEDTVLKISELTSKYDYAFTITLIDDKDFGSPNMHHFEIRGN